MSSFSFPAESSKHTGTIMNWPTTFSMVGPDWSYEGVDVSATRREIVDVVRTIARYEPVKVFVRDPKTYDEVGDSGFEGANELLSHERNVTVHLCPHVDSLWTRDTGPLFVRSKENEPVENIWTKEVHVSEGTHNKNTSSTTVGMVLSFNQWGRKLPPSPESYLASTICRTLNISSVLAPFVGEGGGLEMDGQGTLLATESSLLNPNRNPGLSRELLESYFSWAFGVRKTVWIPGKRGQDITDDHIDALARFSGKPGVVLLSRAFVPANASEWEEKETLSSYLSAKAIIEDSTDVHGRRFTTATGEYMLMKLADPRLTIISAGTRPSKGFRRRLSSRVWPIGFLCQLSCCGWRRSHGEVWR